MMKGIVGVWVIFFVLLSTAALAVQKAPRITDREIVERLTRLEEGQKALNKRIDDLNRRLEEGQKTLNKRIDDLRDEMKARFADVNRRIDDVNGRIDDLRFEMSSRFNILQWMLGLFITIALVILGFVLRMQWQMGKRQTTMETTLRAQREELQFIRNLIEKLLPPKGVL